MWSQWRIAGVIRRLKGCELLCRWRDTAHTPKPFLLFVSNTEELSLDLAKNPRGSKARLQLLPQNFAHEQLPSPYVLLSRLQCMEYKCGIVAILHCLGNVNTQKLGWRNGSAAKEHWLLSQRSWVQFPATTWWLTTICNGIQCPHLVHLKRGTVYSHTWNK